MRSPTTSTAATCGSGPTRPPTPREGYHWFLGEGIVHGVRLEDGHARWYRNRYVRRVSGNDFRPATQRHSTHAGRTLAIVEAGARPVRGSPTTWTPSRPCDLEAP